MPAWKDLCLRRVSRKGWLEREIPGNALSETEIEMLVADIRNGPGRGVFRPLPRHPANPHRLGIGRGVGVRGQDIGVQLDRGAVEIGDGGGGRDTGRKEKRRSDQEKFLHEVCPFSDAAPGAADGTVVARGEERRAGVGYFAMMGGMGRSGWVGWSKTGLRRHGAIELPG